MAEEVLKEVEDHLNCPVCLDTFNDPKQLQCHHVCCKKCLESLVKQSRRGRSVIGCPTCRGITLLSAKGVAGLQSAFHVNRLLDIQGSLKKLCTEASAVGEASSQSPVKKPSVYCPQHSGKELELYCKTCMKLICCYCALKGGEHQNHDYGPLIGVVNDYNEEMKALVADVMVVYPSMEENHHKLKSLVNEMDQHMVLFDKQINMIEVLDLEAKDARLNYICHQKLLVGAQRVKLGIFEIAILECRASMDSIMKRRDEINSIDFEKYVISLKHIMEDICKVRDNAVRCQEIAKLRPLCLLDPLQCRAAGKGLCIALVDQESTCTFDVLTYTSEPYVDELKTECELISKANGTKVNGSVNKVKENRYQAHYLPVTKGKHLLHIKVNGQEIRESPFKVDVVKTPIEAVGYPINILYSLRSPLGIAASQNGQVYVCEGEGQCISVFDPSGEKIRSFGTPNLRQNRLQHPRGITVNDWGTIFVIDTKTSHVYCFRASGYLCQTHKRVVRNRNIQCTVGSLLCIAFNKINNKLYVSDSLGHVWILNSDLTCFGLLGGHGTGKGEFSISYGIACDNTGKVYVADSGNHRIQVFTAGGTFVRMFGCHGNSKGELDSPVGIAVDACETVYVCEHNNCCISVFTTNGSFITCFGERGFRPGQFICPGGIAVDADRKLYVCDRTSRIQVFSCKDIKHPSTAFKFVVVIVVVVVFSIVSCIVIFSK